MVTYKKLRTCEGKQVFLKNKFQICDICRSNQIPSTNQNTDFTIRNTENHACAPMFELPSFISAVVNAVRIFMNNRI